MKKMALVSVLMVSSLLILSPASAETAGPAPGKTPLGQDLALQVSDGDRCPVCAMKVANHPKFASAIQLENGDTFYFCGTGCMIRTWMHPAVFLGVEKASLELPVVQAYFTGEPIDARKAIWVAGSDVMGPMGPALVPLETQKELEAFKARHGGKTVFRLSEMTDEKWKAITGKSAAPKKTP
jgi:nitrous oxide reductase accessory protein NosL